MKTLDEMIAVMQAAKEGKDIEWRPSTIDATWKTAENPLNILWNWIGYDYRVKPVEPIRIYCTTDNQGNWKAITTDTRIPMGEFIELTQEIRSKIGL